GAQRRDCVRDGAAEESGFAEGPRAAARHPVEAQCVRGGDESRRGAASREGESGYCPPRRSPAWHWAALHSHAHGEASEAVRERSRLSQHRARLAFEYREGVTRELGYGRGDCRGG